jgi:hypothetical protein
MKFITYALERQKKLTTFIIASVLLLGGMWAPCDSAKYSAFSLAIAGLATALMSAHAYQKGKGSDVPPPEVTK